MILLGTIAPTWRGVSSGPIGSVERDPTRDWDLAFHPSAQRVARSLMTSVFSDQPSLIACVRRSYAAEYVSGEFVGSILVSIPMTYIFSSRRVNPVSPSNYT